MMTDRFVKPKAIGLLSLWMTVLTALIGGCATMDKDECLNADWQSIGYEDGAHGYKASRIASHRKACAKHGVAPDFDRYEIGRLKGLEEWCTARNGYYQGLGGKVYGGACPKQMETAFLNDYTHGRDVHAYAVQVQRQESDLKKMYADLDALEQELKTMEDELVSPGLSPRRRRQLLDDIRQVEADQKLFLNDIDDMEHTVADMQENLNRLKADNPYQ